MARPKEIEERTRLGIEIDKADLKTLTHIAEQEGKSRSRLVRELIQSFIKRRKPKA